MTRGRTYSLIAIATTLACLFGIDQVFRHTKLGFSLAAENRYVRKARLYDQSPGVDVVITGDSRILHGIDVDVIERVVAEERGERITALNGGLAAASPMTQLAWVRRFVTKPKRPRLVVLSISPYMFSSAIDPTMQREALHTMYRLRDIPYAIRAGATADDIGTILSSDLFEVVRVRPRLMEVLFHDGKWTNIPQISELRFFNLLPAPTPAIQDQNARSRALGNVATMRPPSIFGGVQMGFFIEALRELTEAGIPTAVINTHSATQMELAYGPGSFYDRHIAFVKGTAARFKVPYFDAQRSPAIVDVDYYDADHLGTPGARRLTAWVTHQLVVPMLGGARVDRPPGCHTMADFESDFRDWQIEGTLLRAASATTTQPPVSDYRGGWFLNSFGPRGDADTGHARSEAFVLSAPTVRLRVGGSSSSHVGVALVIGGARIAEVRGKNDERLREVVWDVRDRAGQSAQLELWDDGAAEHITVDDIALCP